jgi:glycosyltransferase involved in cell wall biosynthesis
MKKRSSKFSVVIPVYNSEKILPETIRRTVHFFESRGLQYELILVNDNSPDQSWSIIEEAAKRNKKIAGVRLLKNYGQHTAVLCGFEHSTGDYVITMDDDLQNPPEEIIHLIEKARTGHDLVFGKFHQKRHALYRRMGTKVIDYLNFKIFNKPEEITLSNFRIIHRAVIERIATFRTSYPYIPGLLLMFAEKPANVAVEHHPRKIGKSNYGIIRILELVGRILFNYSAYPLKMVSIIGFIVAFASFGAGLFYIVRSFYYKSDVPGWTALIVLLSFFQGNTLIILGMMGEYIGRIIQDQSKTRSYHIRNMVNL